MSELLKFVLFIYILTLIFSMFGAFIRFIIDVRKWHDKEEKTKITASSFESDLDEPDSELEAVLDEEVNVDVTERGERHTPIIF